MSENFHYSHFVRRNELGENQINVKALREDLKLTEGEISLFCSLEKKYQSSEEEIKVVINGVQTNEKILCDPICIALYYTFLGCTYFAVKNNASLMLMILVTSIFEKYKPGMFEKLFKKVDF